MEELARETAELVALLLPESPANQENTSTVRETLEDQKSSKICAANNTGDKEVEIREQKSGSNQSDMTYKRTDNVSTEKSLNIGKKTAENSGLQLEIHQLEAEKIGTKRKHEGGEKMDGDCGEEAENSTNRHKTHCSTVVKSQTGGDGARIGEKDVKDAGQKVRRFCLNNEGSGEKDEVGTESDGKWSESAEDEEENIGKKLTTNALESARRKNTKGKLISDAKRVETRGKLGENVGRRKTIKHDRRDKGNTEMIEILLRKVEHRRKMLMSGQLNAGKSAVDTGGELNEKKFVEDLLTLMMSENDDVKKNMRQKSLEANQPEIQKPELYKSKKNNPGIKMHKRERVETNTDSSDNGELANTGKKEFRRTANLKQSRTPGLKSNNTKHFHRDNIKNKSVKRKFQPKVLEFSSHDGESDVDNSAREKFQHDIAESESDEPVSTKGRQKIIKGAQVINKSSKDGGQGDRPTRNAAKKDHRSYATVKRKKKPSGTRRLDYSAVKYCIPIMYDSSDDDELDGNTYNAVKNELDNETDSEAYNSSDNTLDCDNDDAVVSDLQSEMNHQNETSGHTKLSKDDEDQTFQRDILIEENETSGHTKLSKVVDEDQTFQRDILIVENKSTDINPYAVVKKEIDSDIDVVGESFNNKVFENDAVDRVNEKFPSDAVGESSVDSLLRRRGGRKKNLKPDPENLKRKSDSGKLTKKGVKREKSKCTENSKETYRIQNKRAGAKKKSKCETENLKEKLDDGRVTDNDNKVSIRCTVCDKPFSKRGQMNAHMKIHTGVKPHVCHICQKAFSFKSKLRKHQETHLAVKNHECHVCHKCFLTKGGLNVHLNYHNKRYKCPDCHKLFSYKFLLAKHSIIHTGIKDYVCSQCGKSFAMKETLQNHIKTHSNVRNCICEFCGKMYREKKDLMKHKCGSRYDDNDAKLIIITDVGEKNLEFDVDSSKEYSDKREPDKSGRIKYKCRICEKIYLTRKTVRVHLALHKDIKKHVCHLCGKAFVLKNQLSQHLLVHSGIKSHECHFCHKCFIRKDHLAKHLYLHTGKKHECPICDKRFTTNVEVVNHSSIHTGIKRYECSECHKSFNTNSQLVHHRGIHDGLENRNQHNAELIECNRKNYPCLDCGKPFATKAERVQHESTHLNIRNFGCDICGKKYKRKISFVNHRCKNKDDVESKLDTHVGGESNLKTQLLGLPGDQSLKVVGSGETKESLVPPGSKTVPYDPPKKIFQCDQCTMNFPAKFQLNNHMKKHSGLKDYKCETCGKCFTQLDNLNRHRRVIHLGGSRLVGKHVCEYCPKVFKKKEELAYHWKNIHGVVEASSAANGEELCTLTTL